MLSHYGGEQDPWDLDHGCDCPFSVLLQEAIYAVCPDQQYPAKQSGNIYKQFWQKVYDWQSKFKNDVVNLIKNVFHSNGLSPEEASSFVEDLIESQYTYNDIGPDGKVCFIRLMPCEITSMSIRLLNSNRPGF